MDWLNRLRSPVTKLLRLPGLHKLRPAALRLATVAAPAGRLSFRPNPVHVPRQNSGRLTVLSANLCHDWPRFRRLQQRLEAIAQLIEAEGVDVVLLQEISRTPDFWADEWLAQRLGMAYVYSRANGHETAAGFEEGLGIYSRFPLSLPSLRELQPGSPFTRRLGLGATVKTVWGDLNVFSVHLSLVSSRNAAQLTYLRDWIAASTGKQPALIGGDFNAHEDTPQIAQAQDAWIDLFRTLHPEADGSTYELRWPWGTQQRRLDYLFLQPGNRCWQLLNACHVDAPGGRHSDHRAVLARLESKS